MTLSIFFVVMLGVGAVVWVLKPWRMHSTAAPIILFVAWMAYTLAWIAVGLSFLDAIPERFQGLTMLAGTLIPVALYFLLKKMDQDNKKPSEHPRLDKVLGKIGTAIVIAAILFAFGSQFLPSPGTFQSLDAQNLFFVALKILVLCIGIGAVIFFIPSRIAWLLPDSSVAKMYREMQGPYQRVGTIALYVLGALLLILIAAGFIVPGVFNATA